MRIRGWTPDVLLPEAPTPLGYSSVAKPRQSTQTCYLNIKLHLARSTSNPSRIATYHQTIRPALRAINGAKMLSRRIGRAAPIRTATIAARLVPLTQQRTFLPDSVTGRGRLEEKYPSYPTLSDAEDPGMTGGYINPPRIKRQFRDPHADWWDKQERRNYGEPVHEDHDMLGMFTPHEYTWVSSGKGALQFGAFVITFLGVCWVVKATYPDRASYPREFEGGLEKELGGSGALRARAAGDPEP